MCCTVSGSLASDLKPKERILSLSVNNVLMDLCCATSYRNTVDIANNVYNRDAENRFRVHTINDRIETIGNAISREIESQSYDILLSNGFDPETGLPEAASVIPDSIKHPTFHEETSDRKQEISKATSDYNKDRDKCMRIRSRKLVADVEYFPDDCVYISIDDVGVRHQKDQRKDGGSKTGKVVENTVIHIQSKEGGYIITAVGMDKAFRLLLAFLLKNHLLENRHLYFFSDGARNIRKGIKEYFAFCPHKHMLDWYHLEKRMTELLSMALKGTKDKRHEIRKHLAGILWAGNISDAIDYLYSLDKANIKNAQKLDEAVDYLKGKTPYICCYALRGALGYRNSSNPAEKANDLVVATRQKHNGMSWSFSGSHALAVIEAISLNGERDGWLRNHSIRFTPILDEADAA